ncbi:NADPH:quinone oxidoreductase family protein [Zavarzinia sp. CC-PAN008]|uniref:NADPH:quinone oxidoreductase family protein n=1 Tax=Zavarzinia sp. CC-PAN008 TaxID=3243332 RepID=UPI003F7458D3
MKAVLCKQYGPPESLVIEDVPSPKAGKGQVVVSVKAAGVNFPDTLIIQNKYQFKPELPFSPGGEVAGVVKELGEGVKHLKVGDRVLVSTGWNGYREEVVADEGKCSPIGGDMDFVTASAFVMTYGTSHHALKDRAELKPGEKLLVLGAAGGVGLAAVELGVAMGARVFAAASSQEKVDLAIAHGAEGGLVYPEGPLDKDAQRKLAEDLKTLTQGGADVIYDPIGGTYAEPALRAINWEGRFLVVGFAASLEIPKVPLNLALLKGCQIVGVFWGAFVAKEPKRNAANMDELFQLWKSGKLKPHVSKTYKMTEAPQALRDMMERKVQGKVVVEIG